MSLKRQVAGRDVLIEIEDTGPGIQEERLARIFDPMLSTSREGWGTIIPMLASQGTPGKHEDHHNHARYDQHETVRAC